MKQLFSLLLVISPLLSLAQTLTTTDGAVVTVQRDATLYVTGGVQHASGASLTNAGTLQLTGDLTNAGMFASSGTLLFNGNHDQTFTPGPATVAYLTLHNTGAAANNRLFILADLTVAAILTLTQGLVRTQGAGTSTPLYTLRLPDSARVVGEAAGRYVQGRLQVTRNSSAGVIDFTNGLTLNPNGQNLGTVTVTRTAGLQTAGVSYGTNGSGTAQGIDRMWQVAAAQPLDPTTPATVTLSWVADDDQGLTVPAMVQLWRADRATGPWAPQGTPTSVSTRSLTARVAQLGTLTLSSTNQPLPVELVAFTAERRGPDGLLRWTTASEVNNVYFQVESSLDGHTFQPLGRVVGAGTSAQAHAYQFTDTNLSRYAALLVYYRLRQVDADGSNTYSPVRTVQPAADMSFAVTVYPNPHGGAGTHLHVRTHQAGPLTLTAYDATGRRLFSRVVPLPAGATTLDLPEAGQLALGVYYVHATQAANQTVLKVVRE